MNIQSVLTHQQEIPKRYTCLGINENPPLYMNHIPLETQSLVLILEDIDATPVPWTHWLLFNIPPHTARIEAGRIPPETIEGLANNHSFGYEGPCPKYFKGYPPYELHV